MQILFQQELNEEKKVNEKFSKSIQIYKKKFKN